MNRIFAIPILFFFSFVFLIYFLLPKYSDFKKLEKEVWQKENFWQKKEIYFSKLKKSLQSLEKEKESLEKINTALPAQLSIAALLNFFEKKTLESGLFLEGFMVDTSKSQPSSGLEEKTPDAKEKTEPQKKEALFSLRLSGGFPSLENFLQEIERSARMIEVERISLEIPSDSKGEILETLLSIKAYSR